MAKLLLPMHCIKGQQVMVYSSLSDSDCSGQATKVFLSGALQYTTEVRGFKAIQLSLARDL
jgi:hypothetical protein